MLGWLLVVWGVSLKMRRMNGVERGVVSARVAEKSSSKYKCFQQMDWLYHMTWLLNVDRHL